MQKLTPPSLPKTSAGLQATMIKIKNAAFYFNTRKFKVLECAEHDDDDDDFEWKQVQDCEVVADAGMVGGVVGDGAGEYQSARTMQPQPPAPAHVTQ